ncbi:hypothetical protein [Facklamia sp. P9177]|uniref:hypothetical protein n=1 Tax=Facklamia sp. P9177 TaxID=3421945 RepID=UPI003D167761
MKRMNNLIKYELKSLSRNGFNWAFAIVMPCVLYYLICLSVLESVPNQIFNQVKIEIFLGFSTVIPLAGVLLGNAATYSKEYEEGVPKRMMLFGISKKDTIISKLVSQIVFIIVAIAIYTIFAITVGLQIDNFLLFPVMLALLIIQGMVEFILAYSIVNIFKKFGPTFAISMGIYFFIFIVSGNMGIKADQLPKALAFIGEKMLPFVEFTKFNTNLVLGNSLNYKMLIMTNLSFAIIVFLIYFVSKLINKRMN